MAEQEKALRNLLLTIRYQGTRYHGFQVQKNALTVAEVLQDAMEKVMGARDDIKGCSRTDSGVHANQFCVSVKTGCVISCKNLVRALNVTLPYDIAVTDCTEVPMEFHARYSCAGKRYRYLIHNSEIKDPFHNGLVTEWRYPLDADDLNRECQHFLGTHDFSAFCAARTSIEDKTRTITSCSVTRSGEQITFLVEGDGFLYNMVRIMVGSLLDLSAGKLRPGEIPRIIASKDRARAGRTAPACGLYLDRVFYPEEALAMPLEKTQKGSS